MSESDESRPTADLQRPRPDDAPTIGPAQETVGLPGTRARAAREGPGTKIGPYTIVSVMGEGGFGTVFKAEQTEPVHRMVALKIIKLGMDTEQVVARFEQERQALAILDHPHVAKVFDAGATDTGRPFFVMELCAGKPVDAYANQEGLGVPERLEIFTQVCAAIQHAHTKGLIHRDIKPSNVLVSTEDGKPHAKVIDFGIAKATDSRLTDKTVYTADRQLIGTIEYMSPEQAEGSLDIDTRTDVYSLGVLLYELLTGTTPLESKTLRAANFGDIPRLIREHEPPRPSTRISAITSASEKKPSTVGGKAPSPAPSKLPNAHGRTFRRELDWIVMKAMEKDRTRRYDSASEFAADVRRYLKNEPVLAAPPSKSYRVKKFIVRHRVGVTAAALVAIALGLGIVGTTVSLVRAVRAERIAVTEAKTSTEALQFLVGLFAVVDPSEARGNTITAREILDKGASRIETELAGQPAAQATLMSTMGTVYSSLGLYEQAEPLLAQALAIRKALAEPGPKIADTLSQYGTLKVRKAQYDEAEPLYLEAIDLYREAYGEKSIEVAETLNDLANLQGKRGDFANAEPLYRKALAMLRELTGPESDAVASTLHDLAMNLFDQGQMDQAVPLLRESLQARRKLFGPVHPDVAESINSLALVLYSRSELDQAIPLFREALDVQKQLVGDLHPDVAMATNNLAFVLHADGQLDASEATYRQVLVAQRELLGDDHPDIAQVLNNLAAVLYERGDRPAAEQTARDSLAMYRRVFGEEHPAIAQVLNNLGRWVQDRGDLEEAEAMFRDALDMRRSLLGSEHPAAAMSEIALASLLVEAGKFDEALELAGQARTLLTQALPEGHWRIAVADGVAGAALAGLERFEEAEPLLLNSYAALQDEQAAAIYREDGRRRLASLYQAWGKPDKEALYRQPADPPTDG